MKKRITAGLLLAALLLGLLPAWLIVFAKENDGADTAEFVFSDTGIAVKAGAGGYKISGTALTINEAGTYVVSGSCADGSITIKKGTADVTLVLNGLTLTSADTASIACNKSSEVVIVVVDGTTNTLTDADFNNADKYPENTMAENAVIKCKDGSQVTICGAGVLNINANGKNGVKSGVTTEAEGEAQLTIQDLTLNITAAVNDGINAEQLLNISSGNITIDAAGDGIHCDYTLNIGALSTDGPIITIKNCSEGLEAAELNINSGNIIIHAEDDCLNAANSDLPGYAFALNIAGGTITADTTGGDGIDSNGSLTISGGTIVVWSASRGDNQPLDADGVITISGGTILAAGGSAGMGNNISAAQPYVTFETTGGMHGGMDGDMRSGMRGGMNGNMDGDMRGGVSGDMKDDGGMNGDMKGASEMQNPPANQPGSAGGTFNLIASGGLFSIQDANGNMLYSGTASCDTGYVFFSSDSLTADDTYTLYAEDTVSGSASAQSGSSNTGGFGGRSGVKSRQGEPFGEAKPQQEDMSYEGLR